MLLKTVLGFVATAAAAQLTAVDHIKALVTREHLQAGTDRISNRDFSAIRFYSQHAAAAYCNFNAAPGARITCQNNACPLVMRNQAVVVASAIGDALGVGAYVAVDYVRREIVLSFRGSNNIRNFIADLVFAWSDCNLTQGCKLHTGFAQAWYDISDAITKAVRSARSSNPNFRVVATGHSLGAAIATLSAAYLRRDGLAVDLYTYGSPRVGNKNFATWFLTQRGVQWRVTNGDDPIPRLPPLIFGYNHISPELWRPGGDVQTVWQPSTTAICKGVDNTDCNGSGLSPDPWAHRNYFGSVDACAGSSLTLRDARGLPEDLINRLTDWSRQDRQLSGSLGHHGDVEFLLKPLDESPASAPGKHEYTIV
ncbi:lipase [Metarhizium anisopliae]